MRVSLSAFILLLGSRNGKLLDYYDACYTSSIVLAFETGRSASSDTVIFDEVDELRAIMWLNMGN
jgi:hypothetical protein